MLADPYLSDSFGDCNDDIRSVFGYIFSFGCDIDGKLCVEMLRRWITLILLAVSIENIQPVPIPEQTSHEQSTPSNSGECCPCPTPKSAGDLDALADMKTASVLPASMQRAVDDCPCRFRDSEAAASSLFDFPVRSFGSILKLEEPREDPKPLLHPEVGLASSVLETLREATDEEYKEAVEREAARSVAKSVEDLLSDPVPEASRNVVTIILKPDSMSSLDRDTLGSVTHAHEPRCIHPLGSYKSNEFSSEPSEIMGDEDFHFDISPAASNAQETIVRNPTMEVKAPTLVHELANNLNNFFTKSLPMRQSGNNLNNILKLSNKDKNQREVVRNNNADIDVDSLPKVGLRTAIQEINERIDNINAILNKAAIPNLKTPKNFIANNLSSNNKLEPDCESSNKEQEVFRESQSYNDKQKSLNKLKRIPINVLKLRDVELIPQNALNNDKTRESAISIPALRIPSITDLFSNSNKQHRTSKISSLNNNNFEPDLEFETGNKLKEIPTASSENSPTVHTDVLDAIPSPSEKVEISSLPDFSDNFASRTDICKDKTESETNEIIDDPSISLHTNIIENVASSKQQTDNSKQVNSEEFGINKSEEIGLMNSSEDQEKKSESEDFTVKASCGHNVEFDESVEEEVSQPETFFQNNDNLKKPSEFEQLTNNSLETQDSMQDLHENSHLAAKHSSTCAHDNLKNEIVNDDIFDGENSEKLNEMATGESRPIGSSVIHSERINSLFDNTKLRQNFVVQPTNTFEDDRLVNHLNIIPSVNPQLPTINELRNRITNFLGNINVGLQKSNDDIDSDEVNSKIVEESSMLAGASSPAQRVLPLDIPRELNINLFNMHPLNLKSQGLIKSSELIPGLNLNTLQARMLVPNIDIKPIQLQSTLGKDGDFLGARLKLGPPTLLKSSEDLLSGFELPDLDELGDALKAHTEGMLKATNLNMQPSSPNLGELRDALHTNAANAMNSLQQSLASTLDEAKVRADTILGTSKYAQPESIFDTISRTRFDVDDKLKEIHSNFADQLSSVHENFMNSAKIPTLRLSDFQKRSKLLGLAKPSQLTSASTTVGKPTILRQQSTPRFSKSIPLKSANKRNDEVNKRIQNSQRLAKLRTANKDKSTLNVKMTTSKPIYRSKENVLVPKPLSKTQQNSKKPTNSIFALKKIQVNPVSPPPLLKRPASLKTIGKLSNDNHFKSILTSTTMSPINKNPSPIINSRSSSPSSYKKSLLPTRPLSTKLRFSNLRDSNGSPSEHLLSRTKPEEPLQRTNLIKERPQWLKPKGTLLKPVYKVNISKIELPEKRGKFRPVTELMNNANIPKSKEVNGNSNPGSINSKQDGRTSAGIENDPLERITKLRNAVRSKLSDARTLKPDSRIRANRDMALGATENVETVIAGPKNILKENVSYNCRLMCNKQ